jgi:hypothetical protein
MKLNDLRKLAGLPTLKEDTGFSLEIKSEHEAGKIAVALAKAQIDAFLTQAIGADDIFYINFKNDSDMKKAQGIINNNGVEQPVPPPTIAQ